MTLPPAPRPAGFLVIAKDPLVVREINDACRLGRIQNRLVTVWDAPEAGEYLQRRGRHTDAARMDVAWLDPGSMTPDEADGIRRLAGEKGVRLVVLDGAPSAADGSGGVLHMARPVDLPKLLGLFTTLDGYGLLLTRLA